MTPNNGIYYGPVSHIRYQPRKNAFTYHYTMLGVNVDELTDFAKQSPLFGCAWYHPFRFNEKDYIKSEPGDLTARIANKVKRLGGHWTPGKVFMVVQCRTLGVYFSPINFYYCFDDQHRCVYLLAEVSNTPWNERHYYLVTLPSSHDKTAVIDKCFHVSPFMDNRMQYKWQIAAPNDVVNVVIENIPNHTDVAESRRDNQVLLSGKEATKRYFIAKMRLKRQQYNVIKLLVAWLSLPFTVVKMLVLIYWQALKLWSKGVPFVPHDK